MVLHDIAYAKINLALHVRGRRADGYHELETLYAFLDDGDRLTAEPAREFSLTITGPFAEGLSAGEDNLVLRAVRALAAHYGVAGGIAFTLDKRLPVASGIGGGSADAAAALRLAARLWNLPVEAPLAVAAGVGADVPACLASMPARGEGVGDVLVPMALDTAGTPVLLVNPGVGVATAAVFRGWGGADRGPLPPIRHMCELDYTYDGLEPAEHGALATPAFRNDLLAPARALAPVIGKVLAALYAQSDVLMTRMSGSGATCFALFADAAARDAAATAIASEHPGWWVMAGALR